MLVVRWREGFHGTGVGVAGGYGVGWGGRCLWGCHGGRWCAVGYVGGEGGVLGSFFSIADLSAALEMGWAVYNGARGGSRDWEI